MVGVVLCGWWWYESKIEWLGVWEIRRATGRAEYLRVRDCVRDSGALARWRI